MSSSTVICEVQLLQPLLVYYNSVMSRSTSQQASTADIVACILAHQTSQPTQRHVDNTQKHDASLLLLTTLREAADALALSCHTLACPFATQATSFSCITSDSPAVTPRRQQQSVCMQCHIGGNAERLDDLAVGRFVELHASNLYILTLLLRHRPLVMSVALLCELCRCAAYEVSLIADHASQANVRQEGDGAKPMPSPPHAGALLADEGAALVTSLLWLWEALVGGRCGDDAGTRAGSSRHSLLSQRIVYVTAQHVLRRLRPYMFRSDPLFASCREGPNLRTPQTGALVSTDAALLLQWSQEQVTLFDEYVTNTLPGATTGVTVTALVHRQKTFSFALVVLDSALRDDGVGDHRDGGSAVPMTSKWGSPAATTAINAFTSMALEQLPRVRHLLTRVAAPARSRAMSPALTRQAQHFVLRAERAKAGLHTTTSW